MTDGADATLRVAKWTLAASIVGTIATVALAVSTRDLAVSTVNVANYTKDLATSTEKLATLGEGQERDIQETLKNARSQLSILEQTLKVYRAQEIDLSKQEVDLNKSLELAEKANNLRSDVISINSSPLPELSFEPNGPQGAPTSYLFKVENQGNGVAFHSSLNVISAYISAGDASASLKYDGKLLKCDPSTKSFIASKSFVTASLDTDPTWFSDPASPADGENVTTPNTQYARNYIIGSVCFQNILRECKHLTICRKVNRDGTLSRDCPSFEANVQRESLSECVL